MQASGGSDGTRENLAGVGPSRGEPSAAFRAGLNDRFTVEVFYRRGPLRILVLTPELPLLFDPALNPEEDLAPVLGLSLRLALRGRKSSPSVKNPG